MRLGREQASGYVEDNVADPMAVADPITVEEITVGAEKLTTTAPAPERAIPVG
jgi:hypothetical protein